MKANVKQELSCGAVIYNTQTKKYLLLHYPAGHWDFPKGHANTGESTKDCALRETNEETGISDLEFIDGFEEKIQYFFKEKKTLIQKKVIYLLAKTSTSEIKISFEHTGFEWLPYKEALSRATFDTSRKVLEKAQNIVSKQAKQS